LREIEYTSEVNNEISLIIPVYNDRKSLEKFIPLATSNLEKVTKKYEIIFCVDPSHDGTAEYIVKANKINKKIKMITFATRAGQSASTFAGLSKSKSDAVIIMDVDMQDPIELIPEMIQLWRKGHKHILPKRISRKGEPISKILTAYLGYKFLEKFAHVRIPRNTGDFRLIDRKIVVELLKFKEKHIFLRGLVALVDDNPLFVNFERPKRNYGETKYNKFFGGIASGMNGILSFSTAFLEFITLAGFLISIISFMLGINFMIQKISGKNIPFGQTQIFIFITFLGGINLISIGVLGSYIGRIFYEVKERPRWIIKTTIGLD
jgi:dolichol-phosphate mannosyltransferase